MYVYLDNAATTRIDPRVSEAVTDYLNKSYGNPSSIHRLGREAKVELEEAREFIASFINADSSEIYFNSGGTEANNFPILNIPLEYSKESESKFVLSSKTEHLSVLESLSVLAENGFKVCFLDNDVYSKINYSQIEKYNKNDLSFISLIHINNETGADNNIADISKICEKNDFFFHTDSVQSFGKVKIDVKKTPVTSLSASGHKIHSLKGIGLTYIKNGTPIRPLIIGGSQERNRRGGTENLIGVIALKKAVEICEKELESDYIHVSNLKSQLMNNLNQLDSNIFFNTQKDFSPYILSLTFDSQYYNNDSEAMLMFLDINGVAVSNGAACSSGTLKPSHVALSMDKSVQDAAGTIRLSFSKFNTLNEINFVTEIFEKFIKKFKN